MPKSFHPLPRPLFVFVSVFAISFLLTLLASGLIAFLIPENFRSTVQLIVEENQHRSQPAFVSYGVPPFPQAEFKIIQSHLVLSNAVDALDLRDVWGKKFNRGTPLSSDQAETILQRRLDFTAIQNTKVIEVRAFSDDPNEAAKLANGVVAAYRAYKIAAAQVETPRANAGDDHLISMPPFVPVTIIQPAVPELRPFRPNRPLIIFSGMMVGIVFGLIAGAITAGMVTLFGGTRTPD